jgi:hypothetical protein
MGAPTNAANVKKVANSEPSTHGGKADVARICHDVRCPQDFHQKSLNEK